MKKIGTKQKVRQWYWCGVLGELYGGAVESRHARDLPECLVWIREGAPPPTTIRDANFSPGRLHTLRTRNGAAYKGIYALLTQKGGKIAPATMDQILSPHLIQGEALRSDDFETFFEARHRALLDLINDAMGKVPANATELSQPTGEPVDDDDDTNDDVEAGEAA
jgi:hypothetical protein